MKMKPRVLWRRDGRSGYIGIDGLDAAVTNKVLAAALERMANPWLAHEVERSRIVIRQPLRGGLGGGAEREHIDHLVRWTRDMVKAELKKPEPDSE